jgi:hypothetical protein
MFIDSSGNVDVGTNSISNILQVGTGERLRISNGSTDFSMIGTINTPGTFNNTSINFIRISGTGNIEYTAIHDHLFYTTQGTAYSERLRITPAGNVGIGNNSTNYRPHIRGSNPNIIKN